MKKGIYLLLLLSFLEGASVMAAELLGAKMMSPYFGSSLYVWSAVMAITLGGLAGGYFTGGILSEKKGTYQSLYMVLVVAAIFTAVMPFVAGLAFGLFGSMSILPAVILSSGLVLFPPVFLMGAVSPLIIKLVSHQGMQAGRASGTVYAISTVGGILATFLFGFWIIPTFGLRIPAVITGCILGIIPTILLLKKGNTMGIFFLAVTGWMFFSFGIKKDNQRVVLYDNEGLLGQMIVVDYPRSEKKDGKFSRWLFVNRISQTMYDEWADEENGEEKHFTYVYRIRDMLRKKGKNQTVLLLGLGGGSIARVLTEEGHRVEACELDRRMEYVSRNYFSLPQSVKVTIDDARHFINVCHKKYDVIIFDTFKGEETPSHVLTTESLKKTENLLNPDGLIFLNSFGYWKGKKGLGMRSIYKTFTANNWKTLVVPTEENENQRNLLFIASKTGPHWTGVRLHVKESELADAFILTDEIPRFEKINAPAALQWRRLAIYGFSGDFSQRGVPLFR
jgi:predicted membrane-bound spermidine synthase